MGRKANIMNDCCCNNDFNWIWIIIIAIIIIAFLNNGNDSIFGNNGCCQ